jgi:hypothetical protein
MFPTCRPIVCAVPEEVLRRLRVGDLDGLQLTPLASGSATTDELERLLGPLWESDELDKSPNFERWLSKPNGCDRNVLLWSFKNTHAKHERLLYEGERLILVSGSYFKAEHDESDSAAIQAVARILIALGGRDVTRRSSWFSKIREWLIRTLSPWRSPAKGN